MRQTALLPITREEAPDAWPTRAVVVYLCAWAALVAVHCLSSNGLTLASLVAIPIVFTVTLPLAMLCFLPLAMACGLAVLAWDWTCFLAELMKRHGPKHRASRQDPASTS